MNPIFTKVIVDAVGNSMVDVEIPNSSSVIGKQIVAAGFPKGALIVLIGRDNEFIVPNGGTVLESGDRLLVLADKDNLGKTRMAVDRE